MKMLDIGDRIEAAVRRLTPPGSINGGAAFPCGLSVNGIAAHWAPNADDKTVLSASDVLKVDIGVHVNGHIVDSAFTMAWDPRFDNLLAAVRDATMTGVKAAGIDVRLADVGAAIEEVMTSYEVELKGRTHTVKPIRNLYGHSVGPFQVHAGKSVPIIKGAGDCGRMEEGETYAIETFGSTGRGFVSDGPNCSHYMRSYAEPSLGNTRVPKAKELLAHITRNHGTLAWAKRWLDMAGQSRYQLALKALIDAGAVQPYPPLCDDANSYVAQFEHTVSLKPTAKEVFSVGDDY
jgi:methionyl aminopeptidase